MKNLLIDEKEKVRSKQPVDKGRWGNISYAIFNNLNKKNRLYRTLQFQFHYNMGTGWLKRSWIMPAQEIGDLNRCVEAIKKWLRDK